MLLFVSSSDSIPLSTFYVKNYSTATREKLTIKNVLSRYKAYSQGCMLSDAKVEELNPTLAQTSFAITKVFIEL
jgi:hypothetical protein